LKFKESCSVTFAASDLIQFDYVNWKGKKSHRIVISKQIYFGSTEYHPELQWLMIAHDVDKCEERAFAMKDMTNVKFY
jgi:hypothetical protein